MYILFTAFLWSLGGLLIKYIPMGALAINGARSVIAIVFFAVYRRSFKIRLNRIIVLAALCLTLTNVLYVTANKLTTAANAIVLQYTAPIFVLLWDCLRKKRLPSGRTCLFMAMAFGGVVLFFLDQLGGGQLWGNLIAIVSGVTFSGVFFVNSLPDSSSEDSSMLAFVLSALIAIPAYGDLALLDGPGIAALLVLGVFQLGLAYVVFAKGSRLTSPVSASLIGLLEAMLNPLWVFLLFGETIGRYAAFGAALILAAVALNTVLGKNE